MNINVILSRQDLADFLDDNNDWMNQYRSELNRRLAQYGTATVEISRNALIDKIVGADGDNDYKAQQIVLDQMEKMGNDWSWLNE